MPIPTEPEIGIAGDAAPEIAGEIGAVEEQIALLAVIAEENHDELVGEIQECRENLASLTAQVQTLTASESPSSSLILQQLTALQAQVTQLQGQLQRNQPIPSSTDSSLPPSQSPETRPSLEGEDPENRSSEPERRRRVRRV